MKKMLFTSLAIASIMASNVSAALTPSSTAPIEETKVTSVFDHDLAVVELFKCVKVEDARNIHPKAVPLIVSVPDPCQTCCDPCNKCCEQKMVNVQICVPPACNPKIVCDCSKPKNCGCDEPEPVTAEITPAKPAAYDSMRSYRPLFGGHRVRYKYGKYEVKITSRNGIITVNYDD